MGKPAARMGDMTVHGGSIVAGCPTVLIGGQPAARLGDMHVCPMVNPGPPPPPHVGGPVALGSSGVLIGGMPAARVGDMATCAGPPDTIAPPGCPTVLIGETGGGGGGGAGGGGAGSGAGSGGAGASDIGLEIATHGAEPPKEDPEDTHWVKYEFVDAAGNPVSGVKFKYKNSDDAASGGILPTDGTITREFIPAGNTEASLHYVHNARWNKEEAKTDEKVELSADTEGFDDGTPAKITIYARDFHNADVVVDQIETEVSASKIESEWEYRYPGARERDWTELELTDEEGKPIPDRELALYFADGSMRKIKLDADGYARVDDLPRGKFRVKWDDFDQGLAGVEEDAPPSSLSPSHPEYYFIAEVEDCSAISGALVFKDRIELELKDADDKPIPDQRYILYLASGAVIEGKVDGNGQAIIEDVPPGGFRVQWPDLEEQAEEAFEEATDLEDDETEDSELREDEEAEAEFEDRDYE